MAVTVAVSGLTAAPLSVRAEPTLSEIAAEIQTLKDENRQIKAEIAR